MATEKLVISLLGPPEIRAGNKVLQIRRRMFRYIVFYLACQTQPVSRESLCELFWPEENEDQSRKNLREVVSKLRHDLPIENLILTEKEYVSFNREKIEVDFLKFESAQEMLRKNLDQVASGKISEQTYKSIQDALSLWRSDFFLGGASTSGPMPFQIWVSTVAETLQYWRQMMVEWLADHCISTGNYKEALNWLSQARKFDKTNTEINSLLLTCLRDLSMWSEARHFCDLVESDYSKSDEGELPGSLRNLIAVVRQDAQNLQTSQKITWVDGESTPLSFIGRAALLTEMESMFNRGGILLIRGESGMGKTRLVREFFQNLDVTPLSFYYGANPGDEEIPYRGIVECFRKIVTEQVWKKFNPIYTATLVPLFPEILDKREDIDLKALSFTAQNPRLINEAFLELFTLLNNKKKGLLILDGIQCVDNETLEVISHIQSHLPAGKTSMIIATARDGTQSESLRRFLAYAYPGQMARTIDLDAFSVEDVIEMTYQIFHADCPARLARQLLRLSGGNPRFLQMILLSLYENHFSLADPSPDTDQLINEEIITEVERLLAQVSKDSRQVLRKISLLGREFSPNLIYRMTGLSPEDLERTLSELCRGHLLEVCLGHGGVAGYRFTHELVAVYLSRTIPPAEQSSLHIRAAEVISQAEGTGNEQAARLAFHYESAGELQEALSWWTSAGTFEKGQLHKESAYAAFQNASYLAQRLGSKVSSEKIYRLVNEWGDLALQQDDLITFANLSSYCLRTGEIRNDPKLIAVGKSGMGWIAHTRGYFDIAVDFLEKAIDVFQKLDSKNDLLDAYFRLGTIHFARQDFLEVIRQYEKVLELATFFQNTDAMLFYQKASPFLIYAYCVTGKLSIAQKIANEGRVISLSLGESNYKKQLDTAEMLIRYYTGDLNEFLAQYGSLFAEIRKAHLDWWCFALLTTAGQASTERGALTECWRIAESMMKLDSIMVPQEWGVKFARYLKGEIAYQLGDLKSAEAWHRENLRTKPDAFIEWLTREGLTKINIKNGEFTESRSTLEWIIKEAAAHGFELVVQGAELELLKLVLAQNDPKVIQRDFKKYGGQLHESEFDGIRINMEALEGMRLIQSGRRVDGVNILMELLEDAMASQYFWVRLSILDTLIKEGIEPEANLKRGRKMLEQAEFKLEVTDLEKPLREFKETWLERD
jgi:DNA-binding SARP family transcriptional activator